MPKTKEVQVVSQAPQHFRSSETQATCMAAFPRLSVCSVTSQLWWREDVPRPPEEFMYLAFTRMPGESYRRRLRSLLLYLCYVFRALVNSLACWCLLGHFCWLWRVRDSHHVHRSLRRCSGQSLHPQESPEMFGTVITSTGVSGDVRDSHHVHRSLRRCSGQSSHPQESPEMFGTVITSTGVSGDGRWTLTRQFWASTYFSRQNRGERRKKW